MSGKPSFEADLEKAFWVSVCLHNGDVLTYAKFMNRFHASEASARRWVGAASRILPVVETVGVNRATGWEIKGFILKADK